MLNKIFLFTMETESSVKAADKYHTEEKLGPE